MGRGGDLRPLSSAIIFEDGRLCYLRMAVPPLFIYRAFGGSGVSLALPDKTEAERTINSTVRCLSFSEGSDSYCFKNRNARADFCILCEERGEFVSGVRMRGCSVGICRPAPGNRNNNTGALNDIGNEGSSWAVSTADIRGNRLIFNVGTVEPERLSWRAGGYPLRCLSAFISPALFIVVRLGPQLPPHVRFYASSSGGLSGRGFRISSGCRQF